VESRRARPPRRLILDLDGTEDLVHGQQHFAFYNRHVGNYCFFPLLVFATCDQERDQVPLGALLRSGKASAAEGAQEYLAWLLPAFPRLKLQVRLDGGFAVPALYEGLEAQGIDYVINLPQNSRLRVLAEPLMAQARRLQQRQGGTVTLFGSLRYRAHSWRRSRWVVVKAEVTPQGDNPRFLVLPALRGSPKRYYRFYTQRGDCENRIKELKQLAFDRTSCHRFEANQFRLFLHLAAYRLWQLLRGRLSGTGLARAQVDRLVLRLMKTGAWVRQTARGLRVHLAQSSPAYPYWRILALYWQPIPD
jgi:hypothetical protein